MGGFKSSFLQIFFLLLSLLSFWFSYNAHVGELMVSHKSLELCALHFSFCFSDWIISVFLYSSLLFFCFLKYAEPLQCIFSCYCAFQLQNFYVVPFYNFSIDILILLIVFVVSQFFVCGFHWPFRQSVVFHLRQLIKTVCLLSSGICTFSGTDSVTYVFL